MVQHAVQRAVTGRPGVHGWLTALVVLLVLIASLPARGQGLSMGPAEVATLPVGYLEARIKQLQQQIASLEARQEKLEDDELKRAVQSSIYLRQTAIDLMGMAASQGTPDTSSAAQAGVTLANNVRSFDELFSRVAVVMQGYSEDQTSLEEFERQSLLDQGLREFHDRVDAFGSLAALKNPYNLDDYLQRRLAMLLLTLAPTDHAPAQSAWLLDQRLSVDEARRSLQADAAAELEVVVGKLNQQPAGKARDQAVALLNHFKPGLAYIDFHPRILRSIGVMAQLTGFLDLVSQCSWLDEPARTALDEALAAALVRYGKPSTRGAATAQLHELLALDRILQNGQMLAASKGTPQDYNALLAAALRASNAQQRQDLLALAQRAMIAGSQFRSVVSNRLPEDMMRGYGRIERNFTRAEKSLAELTSRVAAAPNLLYNPETSGTLAVVENLARDAVQLSKINEWILRTNAMRPKPAFGIAQRIKARGGELSETTTHQAAARELDAFDQQLARYLTLPGENEIRQQATGNSPKWELLGEQASTLVRLIEQQKSAWASAWAAGQTPAAAEAEIEPLWRMLQIIRDTQSLIELANDPGQINRWAGIEIEPEWIEQQAQMLTALAQEAVRLAIAGRTDNMTTFAASLTGSEQPALLIGQLARRLGVQPLAVPADSAGVLGQLLYPPSADALLRHRAADLALLGRCINELHFATEQKRTSVIEHLTPLCAKLSQSISQELTP